MLKYLLLGAVATTALSISGAANAAITISDLGQANPNTVYPLFSDNILVTSVNNAPIVSGGGFNDGVIIGTNGSNQFFDSPTYTDGTTGWNPFGAYSNNQWVSIGGSTGNSIGQVGSSSLAFSVSQPQYALTFVWGSPNWSNNISLYDSVGSLIGSVQHNGVDGELDIYDGSGNYVSTFSDANIQNTGVPGEIIKISTTNPFASAVLSVADDGGGLEVGGVSAVPLPGAMPMFGAALLGLGLLARRRKAVIA